MSRFVFAVIACWVAVCLTLSGCSGCRPDPTNDDEQKAKKKPKPDYEIGRLEIMPSDDALMRSFIKPGHMATASFRAVANNFDLRAELQTEVTSVNQTVIPVGETRFHLRTSRPALLPKGQPKVFESSYFIPNDAGKENSTLFLHHTLNSARGGSLVYDNSEGTFQMPPHQYLFVVLAANPNAYGFVKTLPSVVPVVDQLLDDSGEGEIVYYRVVLPKIGDRAPLPSALNAWTAIAYVLWDGMPVDKLTADQQRAMIDWLHWGGQLVISGPDSLDQLAGSFLAPYLPATSGGTEELKSSHFEPLNEHWALANKKSGEQLSLKVLDTAPLVGMRLRLEDPAQWLWGTGELVAERQVGRGRTVVTSFTLRSSEIVNWGSFDSFVNGGLLRRPPRVFSVNKLGAPKSDWAGLPERRTDPRLISATRYFARDVGSSGESVDLADASSSALWSDDGCQPHAIGGVASWNDRSGASLLAHAALRKAAGISIPKARFVFSVLAIYLLILVPVNWTVFRLLGRVEWAWVAAPVIAVIGAVAVIRMAQLDIGFVRSRTEIGVLEMQGERPQAHLTRYTALYSSLSTAYEFQFDDVTAVARPFVPTPSPDTLWPIESSRDDGTRVSGFQVDSSTTGFIHSEQMCELEGAVRLKDVAAGEWLLENASGLNLRQVRVIARGPDGALVEGKLAELPAGGSGRVPRNAVSTLSTTAGGDKAGETEAEMDVQAVADLALRRMALRPGSVRLVAWTDDLLPGLQIEPAASQIQTRTVVLIHLRYGALPPPQPDANLLSDVYDPATAGPSPTEDFGVEEPDSQEKTTPK